MSTIQATTFPAPSSTPKSRRSEHSITKKPSNTAAHSALNWDPPPNRTRLSVITAPTLGPCVLALVDVFVNTGSAERLLNPRERKQLNKEQGPPVYNLFATKSRLRHDNSFV